MTNIVKIKPRLRLKFKKITIIIVASIFVIIVSVGGYLIYSYYKKVNSALTTTQKAPYNLDESNIYGVAYETAKNKDYSSGQFYLDDKLDVTTDSKLKATIYIYKSSLAGSEFGNDQKKALEYAYEAEKIYPSKESALRVAIREEKLDNIKVSLKYYKIYLERMKKDLATYDGKMKTYYEREYNQYLTHVKKIEETVKL